MPIITNGPALEPENKGIDEFHSGRMESLGAAISEAWLDNPTVQLYGLHQTGIAAGRDFDYSGAGGGLSDGPSIAEAVQPAAPRLDTMLANDMVKKAGLSPHLKLPDQPDIPQAQLEIMMSRARTRREYEATMERGPGGIVQGTLEVGTSFLVGAVDPLNVASAFIPVLGELRYAKLLASAGESAFARAGVRAAVGATEGAVGQAVLEPIDWMAHTQDGRDFGMADVLHNILFGAVLGGALHTGGGAISDIRRARADRPMYPYDLGEPLESHTPWDELRTPPPKPRDMLGEYPGDRDPIFPEAPEDWRVTSARMAEESRSRLPDVPSEAVQTIDDLPQRAKEDAARIGIANLIEGEPLRVGEALEAAARTDPRIAESFAAPKAPRGRAAADPETWSLYEFLSREGGLRPDPELAAIFGSERGPFVPGFGPLLRPGGRSLDDALRLAKDHGYLFDAADVTGAEGKVAIRDLLDRMAEENSGRKQYRNDQQTATKADVAAALERERHEILSALHDEIEASSGQKGIKVDPAIEKRVIEIIQKEGEYDVLAAHERAIMEDEERYNAIAEARRSDARDAAIPGWDVPDVAGAASAPGRADPATGGQAGRAGQGAGRADGGQPRASRAGNRAAAEAQLERDVAWRALSHATPEFDDPAIIAASNAAAEVKRPPTRLDERLTAAEKADAYAKQMYDMFADRLPEGERLRLDDLIKTIDSDHEARSIAIERGAACLFGARE